jgi:hypothetical protein
LDDNTWVTLMIISNVGPNYLNVTCYSSQDFVSPCPTLVVHTSVNNVNSNPFNVFVYPNPFNESITIHANLNQNADVQVSIYDVIGQIVTSQNYGDKEGSVEEFIDVSTLSTGMYVVRVKIGESTFQTKLVKK